MTNFSLTELIQSNHGLDFELSLTERLPPHITACHDMHCHVFLDQSEDEYAVITYEVRGNMDVICQRCLEPLSYAYERKAQLALCKHDKIAEQLMAQYDGVVCNFRAIDLSPIVTDDLYLFVPEIHQNVEKCATMAAIIK